MDVGSEKIDKINSAILAFIEENPKVSAAEITMQLSILSIAIEKRIKTWHVLTSSLY